MPLQSKRVLLWRFNAASKYETYLGLVVTCPLFLPEFNLTWKFSTDLHKSFQQQISRTDGHVKTLIGAFSERANAPKKMREEVTVPRTKVFRFVPAETEFAVRPNRSFWC
jgi:hypothetical protein